MKVTINVETCDFSEGNYHVKTIVVLADEEPTLVYDVDGLMGTEFHGILHYFNRLKDEAKVQTLIELAEWIGENSAR